MKLNDADVQRIEELLAEMPAIIEERGYPYALGCAKYWLSFIVALSARQKEGINQ